MNPDDGVDPMRADRPGAGRSGAGRARRRGPTMGSDGAAAPLGDGAVVPVLPGAGLPALAGMGWTWDGGALPAPPLPALPEQRGASPVAAGTATGSDDMPAGPSSVVRPYVRTGGRTRPKLDLSLETLVSVLPKDIPYQLPFDEAAVLELCRAQSRSVAEVAALHRMPIGVAKVIIGDLATAGLLAVHRSFAASGPDLAMMERVLGGLRRI